jgi:hypothetical protein
MNMENNNKEETKKTQEKHTPTAIELMNKGNIVFNVPQFLVMCTKLTKDDDIARYVSVYKDTSEGAQYETLYELMAEADGGTVKEFKVINNVGQYALSYKVTKSGKEYGIVVMFNPNIGAETATNLALNYSKSTFRHPGVPRRVYTLKETGRAIFIFPEKKVFVTVGKDDQFSLKEAFACAMADYVCGGHELFDQMYDRAASKEVEMVDLKPHKPAEAEEANKEAK